MLTSHLHPQPSLPIPHTPPPSRVCARPHGRADCALWRGDANERQETQGNEKEKGMNIVSMKTGLLQPIPLYQLDARVGFCQSASALHQGDSATTPHHPPWQRVRRSHRHRQKCSRGTLQRAAPSIPPPLVWP